MWTLGIESTAHTLSFGLINADGIPFPSSTSTIKPKRGHTKQLLTIIKIRLDYKDALESQSLSSDDISNCLFSRNWFVPCLRIGASIARGLAEKFSVSLIGVNHCVATSKLAANNVVATIQYCCMCQAGTLK